MTAERASGSYHLTVLREEGESVMSGRKSRISGDKQERSSLLGRSDVYP